MSTGARTFSNDQLDEVLETIKLLAQKSASGAFVFRGEPKSYDKTSSSLYRQYQEIEDDGFDIEVVQREILDEAKKYTHETDEFEILTELQHYGGKTNLIDFTTDCLTALFFACDGFPDEDGRVVLLRKSGKTNEWIIQPRNPANRVVAQKSVFVRPPAGFVEPDDTVVIGCSLKQPVLNYLRTLHGISSETIYNDLHGFIRVQGIHEGAYTKFHEGRTFQGKGDYQQAIERYTEALRINPWLPAAYYNRGLAYNRELEFDLAIQDYDKALALHPRYAPAYKHRGDAYRAKGDLECAIRDYDEVLALCPDDAIAYLDRAMAYAEEGYVRRAIQDYDTALMLHPDNVAAYRGRGCVYRSMSDYDRAIQDYDKALELDPDNTSALYRRGDMYKVQGEFARAIQDYDKVLTVYPDDALVRLSRATIYIGQGDLNRAIQDYDRILTLYPGSADIHRDRGIAWLQLLEWEKARSDLATAKDMGVDLALALRSTCYESVADFEEKNGVRLPEDIATILTGCGQLDPGRISGS